MLQMSLFLSALLLFFADDECEAFAMKWTQTLALGASRLYDTRLKMVDNDLDEDWRDFRARLVAQERKDSSKSDASSPMIATDSTTTWAYETGHIIEEGSVILSRHEHDFCYGLKQQYFHKSIMLVLEHEETTITDGITLNRPTSRVLTDTDGNTWNLWYGGPVRGIHDKQEGVLAYTCLHSLTNDIAKRVSNKIIKNIQVKMHLAFSVVLMNTLLYLTLTVRLCYLTYLVAVDNAGYCSVSGARESCGAGGLSSVLRLCRLEPRTTSQGTRTQQLVHGIGRFSDYFGGTAQSTQK